MKNLTVYAHFSFKRPKNDPNMGIFAIAFYRDYLGKKIIYKKVVKKRLWEDHQFITAVQSYEYALSVIYEIQNALINTNFTKVNLVTDNSTLAGWIENPKKNKNYTEYMERAVKMYRQNAPKEILVTVGLCEVIKYEKSYKFCKEEFIEEEEEIVQKQDNGSYALDISKLKYKSVGQMLDEEDAAPSISGIKEI